MRTFEQNNCKDYIYIRGKVGQHFSQKVSHIYELKNAHQPDLIDRDQIHTRTWYKHSDLIIHLEPSVLFFMIQPNTFEVHKFHLKKTKRTIKCDIFYLLQGKRDFCLCFVLTLTKPWLMKYSNRYTLSNGITYLSSEGMYRIFSLSDSFASPPVALSWSFGAWLICGSESLFGIVFGFRSNTQNVAPSSSGTLSIISIVLTGVMPISIRAAYKKLPKMPAPPVPLDHVLMTFL